MTVLSFRSINLQQNLDIACRFREDSFVASFGHADDFHEEDGLGAQRYIDWLTDRIASYPKGHVHVWKGGEIVGQLEARPLPKAKHVGYVNLYYLAPQWRGKGLSDSLDEYINDWLHSCGCHKVQLSVSPSNVRAFKYYLRRGWIDCGLRSEGSAVHLMEKNLL